MKKKIGFFIPLLLLIGGIQFLLEASAEAMEWRHRGLYLFLTATSVITEIFFSMGMIRIALNLLDFGQAEISDLSVNLFSFLYFLGGWIIYFAIGLGGAVVLYFALASFSGFSEYQYVAWAFILPGLFWLLKYCFFGFLIVDKGLGPIQALKRSAVITEEVKWDLLFFYILLFLFNLAGYLCFRVGLLMTVPASWLALTYAYRELLAQVDVAGERKNDLPG